MVKTLWAHRIWGWGEKNDQELDSSERKRWEGSCVWVEREKQGGQILPFWTPSLLSGGPVLNSVADL